MKIASLPRNETPNGWTMILPPRQAKPALAGSVRGDCVVIGAGYAGPAAARRLAEKPPTARIAVIDAQEVAAGASGRNSGIAMDMPYNLGTSSSAILQRHVRLKRAALGHLEDVITRFGIKCDWARRGKYHAAISDKGNT